jgi:small GTP-binding protein
MSHPHPVYDYQVKVLLLGNSGVGKSALLARFADNSFSANHITTIGIDFKTKIISLDGKKVKIQCWDTAGQERFKTITTAYYRGAHVIFLVYDVTDGKSFTDVNTWITAINQHAPRDVVTVLIGNKTDLINEKVISTQQGKFLADEYKMEFYETSAKSSETINQIFEHVASTVVKTLSVRPTIGIVSNGVQVTEPIILPKKSCCN